MKLFGTIVKNHNLKYIFHTACVHWNKIRFWGSAFLICLLQIKNSVDIRYRKAHSRLCWKENLFYLCSNPQNTFHSVFVAVEPYGNIEHEFLDAYGTCCAWLLFQWVDYDSHYWSHTCNTGGNASKVHHIFEGIWTLAEKKWRSVVRIDFTCEPGYKYDGNYVLVKCKDICFYNIVLCGLICWFSLME